MTVVPDPRPALARLKLPKDFEPAWDLVSLYPPQGDWTEGDYLSFVEKVDTNRLIELVDGRIEVLPVATADLAMEVVSEDDPDRDYVEKRREYARAGIREYWIVDPRDRTITLLILKGRSYTRHGVYGDGEKVPSVLLSGFSVDVSAAFDAANE